MLTARTLLTILNLPRYGKKTVLRVIDYLSNDIQDADELIHAISSIPSTVKGFKIPDETSAKSAVERAYKTINDSIDNGINILGYFDEKYPQRLKSIPDPPPVLYAKGNINAMSTALAVALIGTRTPSEYGQNSAYAIGQHLVELGSVVVSGLALGCDTEGHKGCLKKNGVTIAVLAHGLDKVFPASNRPLAEQILDQNGCLVSEYAYGVDARPNYFVERDRLQSGLSDSVIVVETGVKGGSMHTAGFCDEQGRKLACVKHPAIGPQIEGNEMLIKTRGASALENKQDVENLVYSLKGDTPSGDTPKKFPSATKSSQIGFDFENS